MQVTIHDDFDLRKIEESGQVFRCRIFEDGSYRFITGGHVLYIRQENACLYNVSCSQAEWDMVWHPYFDLDRDYSCLKEMIPAGDSFLKAAYSEGRGIRILRQDHWETLITFIISQRKSIPAIKGSVELLSRSYGRPIETPYETVYTFPSAEELKSITPTDLKNMKVGYRDKYILSAIENVLNGSLCLDTLEKLPDEELFSGLCGIFGVGKKVANCVCLFSYGRTALAPVDTWIQKVIDHYYKGQNPFPSYGIQAGIMQQYIFYYSIHHKRDF